MIEIDRPKRFSDDDLVDIGDGLVVVERVHAKVTEDADLAWTESRTSALEIEARWNVATYAYEIVRIEMTSDRSITSTTLRTVPLTGVLRACLAEIDIFWTDDSDGYTVLHDQALHARAIRLGRNGPAPETLQWVARCQRVARVRLHPPTQFVSEAFGIPHRTASHWIRLAKERGHLVDDRSE